MPNITLCDKDKIDYILKNFPKAKITIASCFDNYNVIAVTDREDGNNIYFIDKKDCEKDEKTGYVRCVLNTCDKDLEAFDSKRTLYKRGLWVDDIFLPGVKCF